MGRGKDRPSHSSWLSSSMRSYPQKTPFWLGQATKAKKEEVVGRSSMSPSQNPRGAGTAGDIWEQTHQGLEAAPNVLQTTSSVLPARPSQPLLGPAGLLEKLGGVTVSHSKRSSPSTESFHVDHSWSRSHAFLIKWFA